MTSSLSDLDGLGPSFAVKMKKVGIRTTEKLLESAKSLKGRQMLAERTEIDQEQLLRVANLIDRMRIKGVGPEYAELLEAAGVVTIRELGYRNGVERMSAECPLVDAFRQRGWKLRFAVSLDTASATAHIGAVISVPPP